MSAANTPGNATAALEPFMRIAGADGPPPGTGAATFAGFTPMNDQPSLADRKAMFVLAVSGMLLSTLFFFAPRLHTLLKPEALSLTLLGAILTLIALVVAAGRCAYAAYALAARPMPGNVIFVQNVAGQTLEAFGRDVYRREGTDALLLTLEYNHTMALLGVDKFRRVTRALGYLRVALPIWMLLLLVLGLKA
jgi:hypothetical protein